MKAQIVSFHCVLKNNLGQVISSSFNRDVINQIEKGGCRLQGLFAGLQDLKPGEKRQIAVAANQAYGLYDPGLVIEVRRSELIHGKYLEIGSDILRRVEPRGLAQVFRVVHTKMNSVVLDGNHPLAGQDLVFDIEVISAREALAEDLEKSSFLEMNRHIH